MSLTVSAVRPRGRVHLFKILGKHKYQFTPGLALPTPILPFYPSKTIPANNAPQIFYLDSQLETLRHFTDPLTKLSVQMEQVSPPIAKAGGLRVTVSPQLYATLPAFPVHSFPMSRWKSFIGSICKTVLCKQRYLTQTSWDGQLFPCYAEEGAKAEGI